MLSYIIYTEWRERSHREQILQSSGWLMKHIAGFNLFIHYDFLLVVEVVGGSLGDGRWEHACGQFKWKIMTLSKLQQMPFFFLLIRYCHKRELTLLNNWEMRS